MPGTILGVEDTAVNKTDTLRSFHSSWERYMINKHIFTRGYVCYG